MTLLAIESWDGIATADLTAKSWVTQGTTPPAVSSARSRTGSNSMLLTSTSAESTSGAVSRALGSAEHATVIVGGAIYRSNANHEIVKFASDSAATSHVSINILVTGAIEVRRGSFSGTLLGSSATGAVPANEWHFLECKLVLSDTVGVVEVRVDGTQVLNLTSQDTKNGGTKTVIDTVRFHSGAFAGNETVNWDDCYICNGAGTTNNTFLGDLRIRCLVPTGNGNSSQLTGSDGNSTDNYLLVDDLPPSTADYVGSATTDQKDTYVFDDLPDTSGTVLGVQVNAYATKTDAAARSLALVTRSAGTDYDGADVALALGTNAFVQQVRETDPATSTAWLRAGVNAAEFGAKVR